MKQLAIITLTLLSFTACKNNQNTSEETAKVTSEEISEETTETNFKVTPISHATMVLHWDGKTIYVDPVGGVDAFKDQDTPDLILITDIHGDHLNTETLSAVNTATTEVIAPKAVVDKLEEEEVQLKTITLDNGNETKVEGFPGFTFEAIPMYNLREEALKFHEKGRGNGYVIEKDGFRVYISGDTEDIPEMRSLQDIDVAFVCMNLPYTMTVQSAASAVTDFKPKQVYPYHYRGTEGLSDVDLFATLIKKSSASEAIEVVQLDWYHKE